MLSTKEDSFFPPRPLIKKDKEVIRKLYKTIPLKVVE